MKKKIMDIEVPKVITRVFRDAVSRLYYVHTSELYDIDNRDIVKSVFGDFNDIATEISNLQEIADVLGIVSSCIMKFITLECIGGNILRSNKNALTGFYTRTYIQFCIDKFVDIFRCRRCKRILKLIVDRYSVDVKKRCEVCNQTDFLQMTHNLRLCLRDEAKRSKKRYNVNLNPNHVYKSKFDYIPSVKINYVGGDDDTRKNTKIVNAHEIADVIKVSPTFIVNYVADELYSSVVNEDPLTINGVREEKKIRRKLDKLYRQFVRCYECKFRTEIDIINDYTALKTCRKCAKSKTLRRKYTWEIENN